MGLSQGWVLINPGETVWYQSKLFLCVCVWTQKKEHDDYDMYEINKNNPDYLLWLVW